MDCHFCNMAVYTCPLPMPIGAISLNEEPGGGVQACQEILSEWISAPHGGACVFLGFNLRKEQRNAEIEGSLLMAFWDQRRRQPLSLKTPKELEKPSGGGEDSGKKIQVVKWQVYNHLIKSLHLRDKKRLFDMLGYM